MVSLRDDERDLTACVIRLGRRSQTWHLGRIMGLGMVIAT